ncbi:unnamed protein product [Peronospora effusa]|nr:unnamed protein product [Peronospora effusa]
MATPIKYDFNIEPHADAEFPAEKGRYHLYVSYSCPYACHALAARNLLGLEDVISLSVVHPVFQKTKPNDANDDHKGWAFVDPSTSSTMTAFNGKTYPTDGCIPDTVNHVKFVRDLYEMVDPAPRTFTVPVLWDKKKSTIVSEESRSILRTLNSAFRDLVPSSVNLYPKKLRAEIDAANLGIVTEVTMGFYQKVLNLTPNEGLLGKQRYLAGKGITEADVCLFHTLIRLDVYQSKDDKKILEDFPNVIAYLRDLYQSGLVSTVCWSHMKIGLESKLPGAIADGPFVDYEVAHERAQLS